MKKLLPLLTLVILAGCSGLPGGGSSYSKQDAIDGAAFRLEAREIYGKLNPVCDYTADADQLARYDAPRARYAQIKEWVADTPFIVDLAVVEGEYEHFWSVNVAECGPTDTEEGIATFNAELENASERLSTLERMAGMI